jgi:CelD/BcsL family acetyltransferase involved in cellulose biosynthesis
MICPKRILGIYRWRLEFLGDSSIMERPDLLLGRSTPEMAGVLWRSVMANESQWDAIYLREQISGIEDHSLMTVVDPKRVLVTVTAPMHAPHVVIDRSWNEYFESRSKSMKKGFRRRLRQLNEAGDFRFTGYKENSDMRQSLDTYLDVESRSWKADAERGVGGTSVRQAFYRELIDRLGLSHQLHFRFLTLNDLPIAATFGVFQSGRFASTEICHDQAFDQYSPGFVLTGLELQDCHDAGEYSDYDFLCGTLNNKTPWGTATYTSRDMYLLPRVWWGYLNRLLIFSLKPAVKRLITKLKVEKRVYEFLDLFERRFR